MAVSAMREPLTRRAHGRDAHATWGARACLHCSSPQVAPRLRDESRVVFAKHFKELEHA